MLLRQLRLCDLVVVLRLAAELQVGGLGPITLLLWMGSHSGLVKGWGGMWSVVVVRGREWEGRKRRQSAAFYMPVHKSTNFGTPPTLGLHRGEGGLGLATRDSRKHVTFT